MEKILIPVDFTDVSDHAVEYGLNFAEQVNGSVTLFHAISYPGSDPLAPVYSHSTAGVAQSEMIRQKEEIVTANLEKTVAALQNRTDSKVSVDYIVSIGFPVEEITRVTDENNFTLVIMGTSGESGFEDTILGNITSNTLEQLKCPVLAVPHNVPFKPFEKIAYATDFNENDDETLNRLQDYANYFDADILAVHVEEDEEADDEQAQELQRNLRAKNGNIALTTVRHDDVEEGLNDFIEQNRVDMVALLHRNLNFWQRLFTSSLSKKMALHSKKPFMVFHHVG